MDLLLMPVSFAGHAITFIKHGGFLAKCDRGVNRMTDPIVVNKILQPQNLTLDFYTKLMYQKQTREFMKTEIVKILGLKPYVKLPIRHQITGNCSWANVEASVPTMLYMLLFEKANDTKAIKGIVKQVMTFYTVWKEWDKDRSIEDCLDGFDQMTPNRRKSKASLLGIIFFQASDPKNPRDVKRAQKMMEILKKPEYHFVLRSYINVFIKSGKGGARGKMFHELLKACGMSPSDFNY